MENKQIRPILLYECKMERKAAGTARNINQAFIKAFIKEMFVCILGKIRQFFRVVFRYLKKLENFGEIVVRGY